MDLKAIDCIFEGEAVEKLKELKASGKNDYKYYQLNNAQLKAYHRKAQQNKNIRHHKIIQYMTQTNFYMCMLPNKYLVTKNIRYCYNM
jgi:hypothetical protein